MELESVVGRLDSLVVEAWINDLQLSDKVGTVVGLGGLGDVDDDTPT